MTADQQDESATHIHHHLDMMMVMVMAMVNGKMPDDCIYPAIQQAPEDWGQWHSYTQSTDIEQYCIRFQPSQMLCLNSTCIVDESFMT